MSRILQVFRRHPWLASGFALAVALTLFFGIRSVVFAVYWADPAHRDQAVEAWMTPRYVAHSWRVPPEVVGAALGLSARPGERVTLGQIAEAERVSLADLAARLEAAVTSHRERSE